MRLFHDNHQVFAHAPEARGIGDAQGVLPLSVTIERVGTLGVSGHEFGALGIKMDHAIDADVDLREVVFVVVAVAQHFAALQYVSAL